MLNEEISYSSPGCISVVFNVRVLCVLNAWTPFVQINNALLPEYNKTIQEPVQ